VNCYWKTTWRALEVSNKKERKKERTNETKEQRKRERNLHEDVKKILKLCFYFLLLNIHI
jgi:hypothetical protein